MSIDLTTQLGSLELQSPIIVGSCPMTTDEMQRIAMIHNGAGAIVLPSLGTSEPKGKIQNYFQELRQICQSTSIPVIGSLQANPNHDGWNNLPAEFQSAGAAAIEISLQYCRTTATDPRQIEGALINLIEEADRSTNLPLFLKLTPNFTSLSYIAQRLHTSVQGLVMFGRSPVVDIELDNLSLKTEWGLTQSGSVVRSLEPLMRTRQEYSEMPLIACGGIGTSQDLVKALLAGANSAMVTSALYRDGTSIIGALKEGLVQFMSQHNVDSIKELQLLCPSLENIRADLDACAYGERVSHQEAAESRSTAAIQGDRYGHPTN